MRFSVGGEELGETDFALSGHEDDEIPSACGCCGCFGFGEGVLIEVGHSIGFIDDVLRYETEEAGLGEIRRQVWGGGGRYGTLLCVLLGWGARNCGDER